VRVPLASGAAGAQVQGRVDPVAGLHAAVRADEARRRDDVRVADGATEVYLHRAARQGGGAGAGATRERLSPRASRRQSGIAVRGS